MKRGWNWNGAVAAAMVALASSAAAQSGPLETGWGAPDLQGVWDFRTITPFERPEALGNQAFLTEEEAASQESGVVDRNRRLLDRPAERVSAGGNVDRRADGTPGFYNNFWLDTGIRTVGTRRTSLVIDPPNGRLPALTTLGRELATRVYPFDSYTDLDAGDRCILGLNAGPPIVPAAYNQNLLLLQTPEQVVLLTEMVHTVRVVPLRDHPRLDDRIQQWSGDARGYWDGDTLVVETTNFLEDRRWTTSNPMGAVGNTRDLRLEERFTRIDGNTLQYEFTVHDPDIWTTPWTASVPMRRSDEPIYEYACHEGNYSVPNILAGERTLEAAR